MADLRRLSSDEVEGQLLGRCLRASSRLDIVFDGAEPARRTLARALGSDGNPRSSCVRLGLRSLKLGFQNACLRPQRGATTSPV
jgi:hypothetical protein